LAYIKKLKDVNPQEKDKIIQQITENIQKMKEGSIKIKSK